jgi:hypothetical protein
VGEAVEQGRGHLGVAEDGGPFTEAQVPAGSCGVRRAAFLPATSRFYSPFSHSLSDPPHPAQAKARKARPSPLFKSTGYPRTNQSVFLWHW